MRDRTAAFERVCSYIATSTGSAGAHAYAAKGLDDFASRVTSGNVVTLIDQAETLWHPEAIWTADSSDAS